MKRLLREHYPAVDFAAIAVEAFDGVRAMHVSKEEKKEAIMSLIIKKAESSSVFEF